MNLDLLILKYIDGELTATEDEQLRNLLKEDPAAREEFDSFLELHLTMVEDADTIVIPASVKRATEDRVMMAILNDTPKIIPLKKSYNSYYKAASVVLFLMFVSLFQINDKFYQLADVGLTQENQTNIENNVSNIGEKSATKISASAKKKATKQNIINDRITENDNIAANKTVSDVAVVSNNAVDVLKSYSTDERKAEVEIIAQAKPLNNSENNNGKVNENKAIAIANNSMELATPNNFNQIDAFPNFSSNEINLSTSISYDFLRNGLNTYDNTSIKNYSQSISYSINQSSRIGLEFGMTEFYYPNTHYIRINSSVNNSSKVEVLDPTGGDNYILVPIQVKETEKNYWGTVFYEQNILKMGEFGVDGRIGLGSTTDGFLGISRIIAKYNVISGLYLSAGAEGRMFSYNLPLRNSKGIANNLSFVWGIYFQF